MNLDLIILIIIILAVIIATFTDLSKRIVPDWLSFGMVYIGVIIHIIKDISQGTTYFGVSSFLHGLLWFIMAFSLYCVKFWEGGDVKFVAGLGTLLLNNPIYYVSIFNLGSFEFMPLFMMLSFIIGMFYRAFFKLVLKNDDIPYIPVFLISFVIMYLQTFI